MKRRIVTLLVMAALAAPGFGADAAKKASAPHGGPDGPNLKVSFKMKLDAVESSGSFVTQSGTQENYVLSETTEKHHGTIFNCMPHLTAKSGMVNMQAQIELSEVVQGNSLKTLQYQGEFTIELGQWIVLVEGPDRHVEIKVEKLSPK